MSSPGSTSLASLESLIGANQSRYVKSAVNRSTPSSSSTDSLVSKLVNPFHDSVTALNLARLENDIFPCRLPLISSRPPSNHQSISEVGVFYPPTNNSNSQGSESLLKKRGLFTRTNTGDSFTVTTRCSPLVSSPIIIKSQSSIEIDNAFLTSDNDIVDNEEFTRVRTVYRNVLGISPNDSSINITPNQSNRSRSSSQLSSSIKFSSGFSYWPQCLRRPSSDNSGLSDSSTVEDFSTSIIVNRGKSTLTKLLVAAQDDQHSTEEISSSDNTPIKIDEPIKTSTKRRGRKKKPKPSIESDPTPTPQLFVTLKVKFVKTQSSSSEPKEEIETFETDDEDEEEEEEEYRPGTRQTRSKRIKLRIKEESYAPEKKRRLGPRSKSGCWTCRVRHKACPENRPICGQCIRLHLTCDYSSVRPHYMTDPILQAAKLKEIRDVTNLQKRINFKRRRET
ncbi:uncharacterized protein RJT21DRAFT_125914 [Scheffersomyces amazonensis]|uniref:uncharacterized protein n=1 Tax=Scheffersomyces amazonensis TaxID=1078765 RepID=UPI00315D74C4